MDASELSFFLKYGYFINYQNNKYKIDLSYIDKDKFSGITEKEAIDELYDKFMNGISGEFQHSDSHVIPLSGGLDSRAILSALMEITSAEKIITYTFGTPGTYDYDLGQLIGKKTGTNHIEFPLTSYNPTLDEMLEISELVDRQTFLFHHPPVKKLLEFFKDSVIWSGYIGDFIAGAHFSPVNYVDIDNVKRRYLSKAIHTKSNNYSSFSDEHYLNMMENPTVNSQLLSYNEQIFIFERIQKLAAPHVLLKGFNYKTPFINNDFMNILFSLPDEMRFHQKIYKKMLLTKWPRLFKYGTKNFYGLPLNAPLWKIGFRKAIHRTKKFANKLIPIFNNPFINYLNFDFAIRDREPWRNLVYANLMDLNSRKIIDWVNIPDLWKKHTEKRANLSDILILLASLEIHIKSGKEI